MCDARLTQLFSPRSRPLVVVLGTNEIASAVAVRLVAQRYLVILSHDPFPPVIRRGMAFHDALYDDDVEVDGIVGERADTALEIADILSKPGRVAVTPLHFTDLVTLRGPDALVDARMQKNRVTPDLRGSARIAVGLGPCFETGINCDVAVETHPALIGSVIRNGRTRPADGVARTLGRAGKERFFYSARQGLWRTPVDIGARVYKGFVLGHHDGVPVHAPMDGFLRGIARDGANVPRAVKLIEIDPRGRAASWKGSDERGRVIAEATVKAIGERVSSRAMFATAEYLWN
jgi:hypothetical protein